MDRRYSRCLRLNSWPADTIFRKCHLWKIASRGEVLRSELWIFAFCLLLEVLMHSPSTTPWYLIIIFRPSIPPALVGKIPLATHSSILAWRIPRAEEPGRLHTVHGVAKSQTPQSDFHSLSLIPFNMLLWTLPPPASRFTCWWYQQPLYRDVSRFLFIQPTLDTLTTYWNGKCCRHI